MRDSNGAARIPVGMRTREIREIVVHVQNARRPVGQRIGIVVRERKHVVAKKETALPIFPASDETSAGAIPGLSGCRMRSLVTRCSSF